jgi:hypothetical protein
VGICDRKQETLPTPIHPEVRIADTPVASIQPHRRKSPENVSVRIANYPQNIRASVTAAMKLLRHESVTDAAPAQFDLSGLEISETFRKYRDNRGLASCRRTDGQTNEYSIQTLLKSPSNRFGREDAPAVDDKVKSIARQVKIRSRSALESRRIYRPSDEAFVGLTQIIPAARKRQNDESVKSLMRSSRILIL